MRLIRNARSSILAAAMLLAVAAPAIAQVTAQVASPVENATLSTADAYAVRASIDKWMEALSARDPAASQAWVDAGVQGAYQGAAADYDADALARSLALTFQSQGAKGTWSNEIEEIAGSGDLAIVRSKRTLTRSADSGSAAAITLRLLEVYARYSDGSWRLSRFLGYPG
jgi:ketosteroid isomerase-like protein